MLLKRCQISISLHPKIPIFFELCNAPIPDRNLMEFARLPWCVQIFVLVCSCLMMDVHAWYSLGPKEILSNNTYILQIYIYMYIYNALGFNAHIYSFKVKIYVIYHNISSNHWGKSYLTAEKNSNGDRQLQSSNLQNKDKSTPYKPQPT